MPLSRRQFFRQFWSRERNAARRKARIGVLEAYVRTHLLPYDFSLSAEQDSELFRQVRNTLLQTEDETLFSPAIHDQLEYAVEAALEPWREESRQRDQAERAREVRGAAIDYIEHFLKLQATAAIVEHLQQRYNIDDVNKLQAELTRRIQSWISGVDDAQLLRHDVLTAKDLVLAELRRGGIITDSLPLKGPDLTTWK